MGSGKNPVVITCEHGNEPIIVQRDATIRGLLEKYPTFGREKETGLLGALDT